MQRPEWLDLPCAQPDAQAADAAARRQAQLTKPPGALGRLETLAIRLAGMQRKLHPEVDPVWIAVFAGDHGVVTEGVSAFPQAVTTEMVRNFARGGAAISVLARHFGATLEVIDLGTAIPPGPLPGVLDQRIAGGTANFAAGAAMTGTELDRALQAGRESAVRAANGGARLFVGGEMGIGNTTAAAALGAALLGRPAERLAGPGTGLDGEGVSRKAGVIARALALHRPHLHDPLETLRRLGGFEIAGLTGAFATCAQMGLPVLVDGFIATAAALVAERVRPGAAEWFLFAHASAEPGHAELLNALSAEPLLDLGMRLGEGSGAAVALPLLRLACALHNEMATFAEAGVSSATAGPAIM